MYGIYYIPNYLKKKSYMAIIEEILTHCRTPYTLGRIIAHCETLSLACRALTRCEILTHTWQGPDTL